MVINKPKVRHVRLVRSVLLLGASAAAVLVFGEVVSVTPLRSLQPGPPQAGIRLPASLRQSLPAWESLFDYEYGVMHSLPTPRSPWRANIREEQ